IQSNMNKSDIFNESNIHESVIIDVYVNSLTWVMVKFSQKNLNLKTRQENLATVICKWKDNGDQMKKKIKKPGVKKFKKLRDHEGN
ncbi:11526_t:CDS:2, partial [Racocetra fulgida]